MQKIFSVWALYAAVEAVIVAFCLNIAFKSLLNGKSVI